MSEAPRSNAPPSESGRGGGRGGGSRRKGGRGGGRGGGGRGGGRTSGKTTEAQDKNQPSSSKPPSKSRPGKSKQNKGRRGGRGGGGGGGGKGGSAPAAPKPMTEEEKQRLEDVRIAAEEKAKAEEERKRAEEAQRAIEAAREARRQEQADLQRKIEESYDSLSHLVETTQLHKTNREAMQAEQLTQFRKDFEKNKKNLKSDLKKCTAFVKKIKSGGAWSMKPTEITRDVATLNLSRYVEEVAAALLESKIKVVDLPVVVSLCVAMHQRYADFLPALMPSLWTFIHEKPTEETAKTRRLYVRLVTEFLLNGVIHDPKPMMKLITEATGASSDGNYAVTDAILVVSFVKAAGFEILGTTPRSVQHHMELLQHEAERARQQEQDQQRSQVDTQVTVEDDTPVAADKSAEQVGTDATAADANASAAAAPSEEVREGPVVISMELAEKEQDIIDKVDVALMERALSEQASEIFATHCLGAYGTLSTSLVTTHTKLQKMEKRCEQDRLLAGALSEAREKGLTDARKLRESLLKSVEVLSDALDQNMPELQEEQDDGDAEGSGVGLELWTKEGGDGEGSFGPFDDEETRDFYCDIPDLLTTIPPTLLGMTPEDVERIKAKNIEKYGDGFDAVQEDVEGDDANEDVTPLSAGDLEAAEALEEASDDVEADKDKEETDAADEENKDTPHYKLMVLLEQELPECSRREQVDEIADKFCVNHGSSKNSRKRLANTLFLVPRTRLDLLAYYSRLAAILDRVFPDVSTSLVTELEQQFHGQAKFKKNQNVESRLKTARYLGELTKFRVAPPIVALRCLRRCLDDFTGFNIDVACCILESCGRYLHRTKHTEAKLTALMDTMMRISKAKNLDERSIALINSAFFMVKPPPAARRKQAKVYPPLEAYLRHLLMVRLGPEDSSISFVTKQLLRFPWNDPSKQCGPLICKYMLKTCRRGRYKAIGAVAAVAAGMRRSKPEVVTRIADAVLEELQWSIEHPNFRDQHRTITYAHLLGELYCASCVTSHVVIQQLYQFINFGHDIPEALRQASEKLVAAAESTDGADSGAKSEQLPVYNSSRGVAQTIQEDEEMDDDQLITSEQDTQPPQQQVVAVSLHSRFDPRVPSPIDSPSSSFRLKLVCSLLEASVRSLVTRTLLPKLEGFMAAFQRYLFTKLTLPTEVEFAILDTFDALDSRWKAVLTKGSGKSKKAASKKDENDGFPRYRTWIDAHNATVAFEEADAQLEARTNAKLEALAGAAETTSASNTEDDVLDADDLAMLNLEEEESIDDHHSASAKDSLVESVDFDLESDDEDASGSESEEDYISEGSSDEDMSDGSNDSEDDLDEDEFSEEELDEEAYMRQLEEEAFERELRRLTLDALERGKTAARKQVSGTMPSGSQFVRKKPAVVASASAEEEAGPKLALGGQEGISFQLLKRGNKGKVDAKELVVPSDTNLAKVATKQDDEAARERDMLKARVLQYEAESADTGGNVYLEQSKLQVIRNRPLSMEDIDRNFGVTRGGSVADNKRPGSDKPRSHPSSGGRGSQRSTGGRSGGGRGRGRSSGRSLYF